MADATCSLIETNILDLPQRDQGRTKIVPSGNLTSISVAGKAPLRGFSARLNDCYPNLKLNGAFKASNFIADEELPGKIKVKNGKKVTKTTFDLRDKSSIKFANKASAKKVIVENFGSSSKLKYGGEVYRSSDINRRGNGFDGLSTKVIRLI